MKSIRNILALVLLLALALPFVSVRAVEATKPGDTTLTEPAKSVLENYIAIQTELAKDSIKGLGEQAAAIAKSANADEGKSLPPDLAKQAETLAGTKDIKAAREAFKPLSATLAKYVAGDKAAKKSYREAYCPMVKANWLQKGQGIRNPYMGKAMVTCGELRN